MTAQLRRVDDAFNSRQTLSKMYCPFILSDSPAIAAGRIVKPQAIMTDIRQTVCSRFDTRLSVIQHTTKQSTIMHYLVD